MKIIPPYSKPLHDLQLTGHAPKNSVYIWIGNNAWIKGKSFSASQPTRNIVLPPWDAPEKYKWPVFECDILIQDTGYAELDYVTDLVFCLYQDGASIVRYVAPDFTLTVFHKD